MEFVIVVGKSQKKKSFKFTKLAINILMVMRITKISLDS